MTRAFAACRIALLAGVTVVASAPAAAVPLGLRCSSASRSASDASAPAKAAAVRTLQSAAAIVLGRAARPDELAEWADTLHRGDPTAAEATTFLKACLRTSSLDQQVAVVDAAFRQVRRRDAGVTERLVGALHIQQGKAWYETIVAEERLRR